MKLSTKGLYGLRALVDLGIHAYNNQHISLASIAERQQISEVYLEQVFSTLRKAGIVKSVKGAQGGYMLTKVPRRITVGMILRALEGDLSVVEPDVAVLAEENKVVQCVKMMVWDEIDEKVNGLVNGITLEDLVEEQNRINRSEGGMYYI